MDEDKKISVSLSQIVYAIVILVILIALSGTIYQKYALPGVIKNTIDSMNPSPKNAFPITKDDHILGKMSAPVKMVVYTDFECPFCKTFHDEINSLKDNYIADGKIAVIYRNMPLDSLHTKAFAEAVATECANKLGDNDIFWKYADMVFAATPSNDGLDLANLPKFAKELGLDEKAFNSCLEDKAINQKVRDVQQNGQDAGANGTPYPIVYFNGELKGALPGYLPAVQLKAMVDSLMEETK